MSSLSLEAYQTLGCDWLFQLPCIHLFLMAVVAWQWKGCDSRWKKMPVRSLASKDDWSHLGPEMSAKIQEWWDNEHREDFIKMSTDGFSYYKFVLKDKTTQGALVSGGKASCSILLKPINVCILIIEEVTKVANDYVRVTFQFGMSGVTWFSKTSLAVHNWRMFLTMCSGQLESKLTKPEVKFVRVMRMDGTFVDMAQHPLDENHTIDERHPFARKMPCKRPASKSNDEKPSSSKPSAVGNATKKLKQMDMPLTEGERKKFAARR